MHALVQPVPKIIHQIWGLSPNDRGKPVLPSLAKCSETWRTLNPSWHYKLWDRTSVEHLIASCPEHWQKTFKNLEHWVEQCDFARYVIVYIYGGIYADLDTVCKVPAENFTKYTNSLIVGLEANVNTYDRAFHKLARNRQLCQWTFASCPRHPGLYDVIENICKETSLQCFTSNSILNTTGPGIFTDTLFAYEPTNEFNIVVLGISAFACGQTHSQSPAETDKSCFVVHQFEGSWKVPNAIGPIIAPFKKLWRLMG